MAGSCQKPDQKTVDGLLSPLQASIEAISRAKEANRRDRDWLNHLTLIGEGGPSVGWVVSVSRPVISSLYENIRYESSQNLDHTLVKSKTP